MTATARRVVTGHDHRGVSVVVADGPPPQHHRMSGPAIGADFIEMWSSADRVPKLSAMESHEPNEREFTIMPASGHLLRLLEIYPASAGGKRTPMHRTQTIDYVVMIEGEMVLILEDSEVVLKSGDVVVQRGTNHAWENRSARIARAAFFHVAAEFSPELVAALPSPLDLMR
jgi:quercetin dioxygenase-like cupin family protein